MDLPNEVYRPLCRSLAQCLFMLQFTGPIWLIPSFGQWLFNKLALSGTKYQVLAPAYLLPTFIFTKMRWPQSKFHDLHVWGCLVYVLDKKKSDCNKIPKWKPHSHRCVNLGRAPSYASSISLCLNTGTGSITPQFYHQALWMVSQLELQASFTCNEIQFSPQLRVSPLRVQLRTLRS